MLDPHCRGRGETAALIGFRPDFGKIKRAGPRLLKLPRLIKA
jgi:hypothetical protein